MEAVNQLFQNLSSQITTKNNKLQEQFRLNEHRFSSKFQWIIQDNDDFKTSVGKELGSFINIY